MVFRFNRRTQFIIFGILLLCLIISIPFGLVMLYYALVCKITIDSEQFRYTGILRKKIAVKDITEIFVSKPQVTVMHSRTGSQTRIVKVICVISYGAKKFKFLLSNFENSEQLVKLLAEKSGKAVQYEA